jgi:hypothetical protein
LPSPKLEIQTWSQVGGTTFLTVFFAVFLVVFFFGIFYLFATLVSSVIIFRERPLENFDVFFIRFFIVPQ